ncbi:hypothetical protein OTU49_015538, partial [Cherax quadricarinatus]
NKMDTKPQHSVPVPRLYKEASKILRRYENKEGAIKTLVYKGKYKNFGRIYGLLCKTVENSAAIKAALVESSLYTNEPKFDPYLAQVLTAEMLGKGLLGDCKPILTLLKYEGKIRSFAGSNFSRHSSHVMKDNCPRYVRVNTLKTSLSNVQYQLDNNGWSLQEYDPTQVTYSDFLKFIQELGESTYLRDYHVDELLIFPPKTPFWDNFLYTNNDIILQDKASCLPVLVSGIKPGSNVIDACAAPGNKTSYIAAAINNTGHVVAIEKDLERYQTLQRLVVERRATCVTTLNQDFTRLPLDKYSQVEFIFVDPSCSSSGVNLHNDEVPEERIRSLACFQAHLLRHALSFPSVQEVIYSTCSVYVQENEEVVQNALKEFQDQFELEDLSEKLSGWKHFGNESFVFGRRCLRTRTDVDKCHGFFVAKFVRISKICNRLTSVNKIDKKRKQQKSFKNLEIVSGNSKNLESKLSEVVTCAKKKQKVKR